MKGVNNMPFFSENIDVKIREVGRMKLGCAQTVVAPRPYHCFALRIRGKAEFDFGDRKLTTDIGDVFYMPCGVGYKVNYFEENEIVFIHFESAVDSPAENFSFNSNVGIISLFLKILEIWQKRAVGSYFHALSSFAKLLYIMAENLAKVPNTKTIESFESAIIYMENNFTDPSFSVDTLVKCSHMSNTYFRKLFLSKYGKTPAKYILYMRLSYAEKLLSAGRYSVKEVSEMAGFSDVKYFSRAMRSEYGVSPSKLYMRLKY